MEKRTCAANDCENEFVPKLDEKIKQEFCSKRCGNRMRQRRFLERHRCEERPTPPGGGGDGGGLQATLGGAIEYGSDGSVSDKNRYSVKPGADKKPPASVNPQPQRSHAHAA